MKIGTLLYTLIKAKFPIEYSFQKPGQLVASTAGIGAAHVVFADG